jgi:aspartyl-tRNA(Asn)/glutamyl-tRNA(Gln) amidotransferase subunit A
MTDLADLTAVELLDGYASGAFSPVEAARAVLARIGKTDPAVGAFCLVDEETTLAQARAAEQRWRAGEPRGLVDGVPCSVKDLLYTAGWPTLRGTWSISPDRPWEEDAPAVARLREHGAVLVGKTTTPEFGWKGVTDSPRTGVSGNPWDPSRTCGGSSGGSAAAVALGAGPLSLGTDGGGSVRIPAAFSGIFGLKPTYGRVPLYPASPFGTLSHVGPMTRTPADAALLMDVVCGPDSRDWSALPPESGFRERLGGGVRGLWVAFSPSFGGAVAVHPEVAAAVERAVRVLAELGAEVEEVDPGFEDPVAAFHDLWFGGAAKVVEHLTPEQHERLDPGLREIAAQGARLSALEYLEAVSVRMALGVRMGRFHERYPLLVTPALPIPAFAAGREVPEGSAHARWTGWTPFTYPFNLTQQPAASLPCGLTGDGLPVGVQLVAARHEDALVLRVAHALHEAGVGIGRRPPLAG